MSTDYAVVIPWRDSGDPDRAANLDRVLLDLTEWAQGRPVVLASDGRESGPFNRSAAYNAGMRLAPADVWVFHEADMLVPFDQLDDAVRIAQQAPGLVVPFTHYRYLDRPDSVQVRTLEAEPEDCEPEWSMENGRSIGAVGVVSAEAMSAVGRWDETLEGHGYDDNAMFEAFATACGMAQYVAGDAWHLWHPSAYAPWEKNTPAARAANFSPEEVAATYRNRERVEAYRRATIPEQVRALTMEGSL